MTTGRTPKTPFGNAPSTPERRGAPLPLMTQPMMAVEPAGEEFTRIENPAMSAVFSKPTALSPPLPRTATIQNQSPVGTMTVTSAGGLPSQITGGATLMSNTMSTAMSSAMAMAQPGQAPPEVGLTQHHLPDGEAPDRRLTLVNEPDSERAAAFRVLRHHLLEIGRPQVVIVSSPIGKDGKTTVALNLALALAECGRAKVLLAETNVARPQLSKVFKVQPPWCFAEQLAAHRHQPMLPWSFVEIPQMWLHVAPINPQIEKSQLLDAPAFPIAMERLRLAGYEHIVIDAPAVLGSADVNLMADAADGVVFALRARRSNSRDLRKAVDQLGASKVVGTVLIQD